MFTNNLIKSVNLSNGRTHVHFHSRGCCKEPSHDTKGHVQTAGGAVGGFDMKAEDSGENGEDVALYWNETADIAGAKSAVSVDIAGTGSDGNAYTLPVDLVFFGDNVLPDEHFAGWGVNDYQWTLEYGGNGVTGSPRTAIFLSPSWANVPVADGGGERQQRYTQNDNALASVSNTAVAGESVELICHEKRPLW